MMLSALEVNLMIDVPFAVRVWKLYVAAHRSELTIANSSSEISR